MGLHHRFPSYFYKRGNLFNTYLGYTETGQTSSAPTRRRGGAKRAKRTSLAKPTPHRQRDVSPEVERFSRFVQSNLTPEDAERLLGLLAGDAGVRIDLSAAPTWSMPMKLVYFAEEHLSEIQAKTYTDVLERRLLAREALIRK